MNYIITKLEESQSPKRTVATVRVLPTGIWKFFFSEKVYVFTNIKGDWVTESGKVAFGKLKILLAEELSSLKMLREMKLEQETAA